MDRYINIADLIDQEYILLDPQTGTVVGTSIVLVKVSDIEEAGIDPIDLLDDEDLLGDMVDQFGRPIYALR